MAQVDLSSPATELHGSERGQIVRPEEEATPVGFEPTRGDPIGLAGRRLNRSAKVSLRAISKYSDLCNPGSHACRLGKQPQREACAALRNI